MTKVALITGGTSGLGLAMAEALANSGKDYIVYAAGRKFPDNSKNEKLHFVSLDLEKPETVKALIERIILEQGKIDTLINNAGIGIAAALEEIPLDKAKQAFEINYFGTLRMIQTVVPYMRKQNHGLIINMSSIGGLTGLPFQGIYSSTKFAIEGLTEALSIELKSFGIKVCLIEPGDYNTNVSKNRMVIKPEENSPYTERLNGFFEQLNTNIEKGLEAKRIGKLALKICESQNPNLKYRSGRFFEIITPTVQNLLPGRLWEKILAKFYNL